MAKFDASDDADELRKRFATFPQGLSSAFKNISGEPARHHRLLPEVRRGDVLARPTLLVHGTRRHTAAENRRCCA